MSYRKYVKLKYMKCEICEIKEKVCRYLSGNLEWKGYNEKSAKQ